ncbi:DUF1697 domain-containing protein [Cohnella caldifontis]|uniref:DUF1697 domain-containing protein n=1 Tax=Cohnella caldifontis TaxID=3027471 RepID=UPI0023EC946F|nr:DUF1697 domain-containing protein [Cohnella sp. YIM B05605]
MTVYIALLRGINVGGNRKVPMPALKSMFESLGFQGVLTYINSGNVIFESDSDDGGEALEERIEREIEKVFGFPVDVMIRTAAELRGAIDANPFAAEGSPEELHLHVGFMKKAGLAADKLAKLDARVNENEGYRLSNREVFAAFRAGLRDSKLAEQLGKLGVPLTLRNWNTTTKLAELAEAKLP